MEPTDLRKIAAVMERKMHERDRETDPQRSAVLDGELADLGRAMTAVTHGSRITNNVKAMIAEGECLPPAVPHQFIDGACAWCGLAERGEHDRIGEDRR